MTSLFGFQSAREKATFEDIAVVGLGYVGLPLAVHLAVGRARAGRSGRIHYAKDYYGNNCGNGKLK